MTEFEIQRAAHRMLLASSSLSFTKKMFEYTNHTPYIIGEHHRLICEYLDKVVKGEIRKLMINIAPRYGKCVSPYTRIMTSMGLVDACDIKEGDTLYTFDNGKLVLERCNGTEKAYKDSVRVTLRSGRSIECSSDHPLLSTFDYVEAGKLNIGDGLVAIDSEKDDFYYDKVVSVEPIGPMELIHLEVNRIHNFIANGIVSHNTLLVSQSFIAYGLALNPKSKFLHLSYSGGLTSENSMAVKDMVKSEYFQACFEARVRFGKDTRAKWSTESGGGVYATSFLGQITGFGAGAVDTENAGLDLEAEDEFTAMFNPDRFAGAIVIDDPIKPDDALSDTMREAVNRRFETTIRNRVNSRKTPIIIIMQRVHEHDLCGYLQEIEPNEWTVLSIPCISYDVEGNEKPLWEFKHSLEELHKIEAANAVVFQTQYMQNPTPLEGLMYEHLRTYDVLPAGLSVRKNYTDTADTGSDYHCSICYLEFPFGMYVTDILYTKKPMEYTEPETARMLSRNRTQVANIESNNGGRGFARNVERILRETGNKSTQIRWFAQTENKQVRIFSHAAEVQNLIYFPKDWEHMWPEFAHLIKYFRREGKPLHDDGPDVLTGMCEKFSDNKGVLTDSQILEDFD